MTQRQDVGAEDSDDDGCCIEPCSKEDGEKCMPCEGGCNVRVHLSCYLAQEWVKQDSKASVKDPKGKVKPKSMNWSQSSAWCEACTIKTVKIWLAHDNGAAYANLNKERLGKAGVWIMPKTKKEVGVS